MNQEKGIYFIYRYNFDYNCVPEGYIYGTEEEAQKYCTYQEKSNKFGWYFGWQKLDRITTE